MMPLPRLWEASVSEPDWRISCGMIASKLVGKMALAVVRGP